MLPLLRIDLSLLVFLSQLFLRLLLIRRCPTSFGKFLNKTVNLDGSPKLGDDATPTAAVQSRGVDEATTTVASETAAEEAEAAEPMSSATEPSAPKLVEKRPRGRPRTKPLTDSAPSKKNLTARNRKAPLMESTLEKVAEEADEGDSTNRDQENRSASSASPATKTSGAAAISIPEKAEPKKKKRKLLGPNAPTLFDGGEDEGERVPPSAVVPAPAAAVKRPAAKIGGAGAKAMGKGPVAGRFGAGVKNAFAGAAFSPLKKERRGVAASFLA